MNSKQIKPTWQYRTRLLQCETTWQAQTLQYATAKQVENIRCQYRLEQHSNIFDLLQKSEFISITLLAT